MKESVTKSLFSVQKHITDEMIIDGIQSEDERIIQKVYAMNYPKIRALVRKFKNLSLETEDVFHDGLTQAIVNVQEGKFKGQSRFDTYLYGICRNICLKQLRKEEYKSDIDDGSIADEDEGAIDFDMVEHLIKAKSKLKPACVQIIDARFGIDQDGNETGSSGRFEDIARILEISVDNARQRFKRCLDQLREFLTGDKQFQELLSQ